MANGKQYPKPRVPAQPASMLKGKIRAKVVGTKVSKFHAETMACDLLEDFLAATRGRNWRAKGNGTYKDPAK